MSAPRRIHFRVGRAPVLEGTVMVTGYTAEAPLASGTSETACTPVAPVAGVPASPREVGSVTVILVGVIAALVVLVAGLSTVCRVCVLSERARAAADQSALAGAAVVLGVGRDGVPCEQARKVAVANRARLIGCAVSPDGVQVRVEVSGPIGLHPGGVARAGAPES